MPAKLQSSWKFNHYKLCSCLGVSTASKCYRRYVSWLQKRCNYAVLTTYVVINLLNSAVINLQNCKVGYNGKLSEIECPSYKIYDMGLVELCGD